MEVTIEGPTQEETVRIVNGADGTLQDLRAEVIYVGTGGWLQTTLTATSATRTEPADLMLDVSPHGLTLGTYEAEVRITSSNASNSPHRVRVAVTVRARPPARIAIATQPSVIASNGEVLLFQPVVQLLNDIGEPALKGDVPITVELDRPGATLTGQTTRLTDPAGRAAFTDLAILGTAGTYILVFRSAGLTEAISFPIALGAGSPASLVADAPLTQTANAGTAVAQPPAVRVSDQSNNPVAGISVQFVAASGVIVPAGGFVVTNPQGRAALTSWTLNPAVGPNSVTASVAFQVAPVVFSATGVTGPSAILVILSGNNLSGQVGTTLGTPHQVRVSDAFLNPIGGIAIAWAAATGGGSVSPSSSITDPQGIASATRTLGPVAGPQTTTASATLANGPAQVTFTTQAGPGGASQIIKVAGDNQTGAVGSTLSTSLSVRVLDNSNNVIPNLLVNWSTPNGGSFPSGATSLTDAMGLAFATWRLGPATGTQTAQAAVGGPPPATFNATATPGTVSASQSTVSANPTTITASTGASVSTITVTAKDANGNPVGGANVVLAASGGGNTLTQPSGPANAAGVATGTLSATLAGLKTVSAIINGTGVVQTAVVTVNPGPAASIVATTPTAFSVRFGQAVAPVPTVRITDQLGNVRAGHSVTFLVTLGSSTLTGGAATTDGAGLASPASWTIHSFDLLGSNRTTINVYNQLIATASGAGIAGNPITFTGTANVFFSADLWEVLRDQCTFCHDSHQPPLMTSIAAAYANIRNGSYVDVTVPYDSTFASNYLLRKIKTGGANLHASPPAPFLSNLVTLIAAWIIQGSPP